MLGKYVEFNPGFNMPSIKTDFADSPYKGQKEIVEYSNFAYRFYLCTLKIQYLAGIRLSKFYPLPYAA